jgi:hypothetical protein
MIQHISPFAKAILSRKKLNGTSLNRGRKCQIVEYQYDSQAQNPQRETNVKDKSFLFGYVVTIMVMAS